MKSLIYRASNGINIVSRFHKPGTYRKTTPSGLQIIQRNSYSEAVSAWNQLTNEAKLQYVADARGTGLTGFNLFLKIYLNSIATFDFRLLESGGNRLLESGGRLVLNSV